MRAYYNEYDHFAAQWLRNLIDAGHIAPGDVDDRSILEVQPDDLKGYTQCHFFAGIGGWSYALRLAKWPDDREVWTGSPPCQPFSVAGLKKGKDDERHLAPTWLQLITERKPATIFGEQVSAAITADGWLDTLFDELEAEDYACGAAVLPACSVSAPHLRQRLWFVADSDSQRLEKQRERIADESKLAGSELPGSELENSASVRRDRGSERHIDQDRQSSAKTQRLCCGVGNSESAGTRDDKRELRSMQFKDGAWSDVRWLDFTDGKKRPIKPGIEPLAHGIPGRVGQLRAYGNAIVPQVAAEVIKAFMEYQP